MSQTRAQLIAPVGIVTADGFFTSGVTTALSFVGNLSGTASIATTATVAQGLTGTPNINVGVVTATGLGGVAYVAITTTSSSKTLVNREYCTVITSVAGTSAGIAVTLPATPQPGWEVGVAVGGTFTDTIIRRNGSRIMGLAEDMTMDRGYLSFQFVYVDSNVGWRFF
jgi:hypothetical protein